MSESTLTMSRSYMLKKAAALGLEINHYDSDEEDWKIWDNDYDTCSFDSDDEDRKQEYLLYKSRRVKKMSNFDDGIFHCDFFFEENIIGGFFNNLIFIQ